MKNLLLLVIISCMALSSCNGKYTIAKRKYNKGLYVNRGSEHKITNLKITQHKATESNELIESENSIKINTQNLNLAITSISEQITLKIKMVKGIHSSKTKIDHHANEKLAFAKSYLIPQHIKFKVLNASDIDEINKK